ncbi:hypothetical protein ACFOOK_14760 [Micromonospora krabiensis]|uniref:FXSXX-COOH protein n=1 Tax=Micromonospora krabiensis TaxID=307121 RepID=A0A1C3N129_9ACTN|nr:hypothetical protein [Micromonospora krabiensis]SBV26302.1 hypothetical protein GA0070620_1789 [Micromonospora krabiensis]
MKIVEQQRATMTESLGEVRRTPLHEIPVDRAAEIVRKVMRHREGATGAVEVARFGSAA